MARTDPASRRATAHSCFPAHGVLNEEPRDARVPSRGVANASTPISSLTKNKHFFECRIELLFVALFVGLNVHQACGYLTSLELRSIKNDDHFEVTKPSLFWSISPQAKSYEIYADDAKVGEVPPAPGQVLNYGLTVPFAQGLRHWLVKAIPATGDAISSGTSTFTVDPPRIWPAWAIGPFVRHGKNPLLRPRGKSWESANILSPGVVLDHAKFHMLYRAEVRAWTSREGYAQSVDGVTFARNPEPAIDATEPFEKPVGCEDARLFKYEGTLYAFYTGNDARGHIALCEAKSRTCNHLEDIGSGARPYQRRGSGL
jgi:hypothetical protein